MAFGMKRRNVVQKRYSGMTDSDYKDNDNDHMQQLPLMTIDANKEDMSMSNKSSRMKKGFFPLPLPFKTCCRLMGKLLIKLMKLIPCLIIMIIFIFYIYVQLMSRYNSRNMKDPCLVAENSLQTIQLLKKSGRDLIHNKPKSILNNNDGEKITMTPNFLDLDTTYEFTPKIPKIIHQQWKDQNVPKKFMKWRTMWFRLFPKPEYTHMLWDDESGRNLIKEHYPWFLDAFDGYTHNINRVDATRYFILYHYGGIYADLDYEPVVNFFQHLPQNIVGIIESPYFWNERTQNSLMSSPKGDPFWIDVFDKLIQNTKKDNILEITGPILMDQAIESSSHPAYILPCENFQRVPLGEYSETLPMIIVQREMTFRLQRLNGKHCGFYSDNRCHFGKHHNTASYVTTRGGGGIL